MADWRPKTPGFHTLADAAKLIGSPKVSGYVLMRMARAGQLEHRVQIVKTKKLVLIPRAEVERLRKLHSGRLSLPQAAERLGVRYENLKHWIRHGVVPGVEIGGGDRAPDGNYALSESHVYRIRNWLDAISLLEENTLSTADAAKIAGMDCGNFIRRVKEHGVPHYRSVGREVRIPRQVAKLIAERIVQYGRKQVPGLIFARISEESRNLWHSHPRKKLLDSARKVLDGDLETRVSAERLAEWNANGIKLPEQLLKSLNSFRYFHDQAPFRKVVEFIVTRKVTARPIPDAENFAKIYSGLQGGLRHRFMSLAVNSLRTSPDSFNSILSVFARRRKAAFNALSACKGKELTVEAFLRASTGDLAEE